MSWLKTLFVAARTSCSVASAVLTSMAGWRAGPMQELVLSGARLAVIMSTPLSRGLGRV